MPRPQPSRAALQDCLRGTVTPPCCRTVLSGCPCSSGQDRLESLSYIGGIVGQPPLPRGQGLSTQPRTGTSSKTRKPVRHNRDCGTATPSQGPRPAVTHSDRLESLSYIPTFLWDSHPFRGAKACPHPSGQARKPVLHNRDVGQPFQAVQTGTSSETRKPVLHTDVLVGQPPLPGR